MAKKIIESSSFFETLLQALPNPIFYKDHLGIYRFCNSAFANYLGLEINQIINKSVYDVAPVELARLYEEADNALLRDKKVQVYEARIRYADTTFHDVIFSKAPHLDHEGNAIGLVGIIQDITEKKNAEREIQMLHTLKDVFLSLNHEIMSYVSEQQLLDSLLRQVKNIFSACDQCSVLEITNSDTLTVIAYNGYSEVDMTHFKLPLKDSFIWQESVGVINSAHIVNNIIDYTSKGFQEVALPINGKPVQSALIVPIRINNKLKWIFALDSSENNIYTETDRKVADFIREELPLVYRIFELYVKTLDLSRYDSLTGLINRRYFDEILESHHKKAVDSQVKYSLVLFDLDGLKRVNDMYGHHSGDAYLIAFSDWLKSAPLNGLSYARVGGDEFLVLFEACDPEELRDSINEARKSFVSMPIVSETHSYHGSFSFGIATYWIDSDDRTKLFQIADLRMYKDKSR